ncbi:retinal rod cell development [Mactra antiquata]
MDKAATSSKVYLTVYGTSGHSDKLRLSSNDPTAHSFIKGTETQFQIETGDIGRISKIRLEHDSSGINPDMRVDYVKMKDKDTNEELVFYLDRWLGIDREDGQIVREMPVIRKGTPSSPGSYKDAGIDNGSVGINIIGVDGDTGLQELNGAISKNSLPWQPGQTDIYILEAVSVGRVKKIELNFRSAGQERWFVQQVSISEGARSAAQFTIYCHQWLLSSEKQVSEFPVAAIQPSTNLIDTLESIPKGFQKPIQTKGRWTVYIQTGTQNDSGTNERVCLVLCGLKNESEPVCVNSKDDLNPGSLVKFEAKVQDIGLLFKIRIYFQDKHVGSGWFLSKLKLKDQDTGEEFILEHNDWIESTNENCEGAIELPLFRPDLQPLKEQIYIIVVKTGNLLCSETEANVYCNLIGQWGCSGERSLTVSSNQDLFRMGQTDTFTLTSTELGDIQKVIIGHDTVGRGQGWYCESVSVKVAEESETIFPCHRWLDTGCDDRKLSAELLPLSQLPISFTSPTRYTQSDGEWNIHVTTAGLDRLSMIKPGQKAGEVSIVIYGTESVKGPIQLNQDDPDSPVTLLAPGKTHHFFVSIT